jgi:ankyrin repeat protein
MTYQHEKIISLNLQLISAIKAKELQRVQELLEKGADPTKTLELGSITPIAHAAMRGATEVIRALLQAGAEVDAVTSKVAIPNTSPF